MTRVLITGASGFIGRPLVAALAQGGYAVRAAARERRDLSFPASVEIIPQGDLASAVDWTPLVAGIDAVVHLAGIAHVGPEIADTLYDAVNHRATAALAKAATSAGVRRFVFMSSMRAQTGASSPQPLTEADAPSPTDAYGRSKLAAEEAVRAAGLPHTILRPVLVYGREPKGNLASLMRLVGLPLPPPLGGLTNRRSLLAVENLIAAVRFALEDARAANETFIVSDPGSLSVAEIASTLRAASGHGSRLLNVPPSLLAAALGLIGKRDAFERLAGAQIAEPAKLMAAGWRPVIDTVEGLRQMAQAASPRKSGTASRSTP